MLNLNKTVKIDPKLSAKDWQLYTASMNCNRAANALNRNLKRLVNKAGSTQMSVAFGMGQVMQEYAKYGANDSEPEWVLNCILDEVYAK